VFGPWSFLTVRGKPDWPSWLAEAGQNQVGTRAVLERAEEELFGVIVYNHSTSVNQKLRLILFKEHLPTKIGAATNSP
jgi:hypothetical protein